MTFYGVFRRIVRLLGSRWGFFPVAIVALFVHGVGGHPTNALPFLLEWALVVGACHWLSRLLPAARAPGLSANRRPPSPMVAVSVTPAAPSEASPDVAAMKARLPPQLSRLIR